MTEEKKGMNDLTAPGPNKVRPINSTYIENQNNRTYNMDGCQVIFNTTILANQGAPNSAAQMIAIHNFSKKYSTFLPVSASGFGKSQGNFFDEGDGWGFLSNLCSRRK